MCNGKNLPMVKHCCIFNASIYCQVIALIGWIIASAKDVWLHHCWLHDNKVFFCVKYNLKKLSFFIRICSVNAGAELHNYIDGLIPIPCMHLG